MAIFLWIEQPLKESNALNESSLLKSHPSCLAIYIYFALNCAEVKKNWKCDSEELSEWKLVVSFVRHYLRSRLEKGLMSTVRNLFNCI